MKHATNRPSITSSNGLVGWVQKMAISADVEYCIYADFVGRSEKSQNVLT